MGFGVRTFKTRPFARFSNREGISDAALCEAVGRAGRGQIDADPGGGVIKQRIARKGRGRSGGFRTIMLSRRGERSFFAYGFAKSGRANLRRDELKAFRLLADTMLGMDETGLEATLANETISEVVCDDQAVQD